MWPWGGGSDKPPVAPKESPAETKAPAKEPFDPKKLPDREKLPPKLQNIIDKADKDENFFDELVSG